MGAWPRSPSPITTSPSTSMIWFSAWRMASTAAWSAAFSSPRPRQRAAAMAAASVTRAISMVSMRLSMKGVSRPSQPLDADHPRAPRHMAVRFDLLQCLAHGAFQRVMGDEDEGGCCILRLRRPLHDALNRDLLLGEPVGDARNRARPVEELERHVIAALMRLELCLLERLELICRHAEGRLLSAPRDVADVRQNARCGWMGPGTAALEHQIAGAIGPDRDRIQDAVDIGHRR